MATQVTGVVPNGKLLPETGVQTSEARLPQMACAVALKEAGVPAELVHSMV